ncbi:MAG: hypothetical protein Q4F95_02060 [Oscillospiraceae bacterium]|nr:hypothetical protein [Oscillospiraceae bacterium]
MYDENEQVNNIQQAARTCSRTAAEIYRLARKLYDYEKLKEKEALQRAMQEIINPDKDFIFTGQATDLCYFQHSNVMPIDFIENIEDEKLRSAVKEQFNIAARREHIVIDTDKRMIAVTNKGRNYISSSSFNKQAIENLQYMKFTSDQCFVLNGTQEDLKIFDAKPEFNISEICNKGSPELGNKVMTGLNRLNSDGLISISAEGTASITEKGSKILNELLSKNIGRAVTKSAASLGAAGACIIIVKKAADLGKNLFSQQSK